MEQEGASIFIYCPQIDSIIQLWSNSITILLEGKVDLDGKKGRWVCIWCVKMFVQIKRLQKFESTDYAGGWCMRRYTNVYMLINRSWQIVLRRKESQM